MDSTAGEAHGHAHSSRDSTPAVHGSPLCQKGTEHSATSDAEELSCLSTPSQPAPLEAWSVLQQYRGASHSLCSCFFTWTIYQASKLLHAAFTHTNLLLPVKQCSPGQRLILTAGQCIHRWHTTSTQALCISNRLSQYGRKWGPFCLPRSRQPVL